MAQLYDSERVREAARAVSGMRGTLDEQAMEPGRRAIRESEALEGAAASEMKERLQELERDVRQIEEELGSISGALSRYAAALEEVGERLTREML